MIASFVHEGRVIDFIPGADVLPGDVLVIGDLVGVSLRGLVAGELGSLSIAGVFDFPKAVGGGSGIAMGTKVYWDAAAKQATATAGANKYLGKTTKAAVDADTTVRAKLLP